MEWFGFMTLCVGGSNRRTGGRLVYSEAIKIVISGRSSCPLLFDGDFYDFLS